MNEIDMYYSRAELQYRGRKLRNAIAGSRERRTLKSRRHRSTGSALAA